MRIRASSATILTLLAISPRPADAHTYAQTITVAKAGGDYDDPVAAVASIHDASADKPYLVKIYPGVYDIGTRAIGGVPFVDIEGSGKGVTVIQNSDQVVLQVTSNEEVRGLTLRTYGTTSGCAVSLVGAGTLRNVNVDATPRVSACGIGTTAGGLFDHVTVSACGRAFAMANGNTNAVLDHCALSGNEAVYITGTGHQVTFNESSTSGWQVGFEVMQTGNQIRITRSTLKTTQYAILAPSGTNSVLVLDSIVDGATAGGVKCVGTVNSALDPVACPKYP